MAYFSSGSEGLDYQEKWCARCAHDGECPVWDAHLLYAYDLCNQKDHPGKIILDMLIPYDGLNAGKCSMFYEDKARKVQDGKD